MKVVGTPPPQNVKVFKTKTGDNTLQMESWWKAKDEQARCSALLNSAAFLKESQGYRYRQAATFARLYGNQSLFSFAGSNQSKFSDNTLPPDRPTFNVVQSAVDTLVSKISQNRPSPVFLTDNGDYKERNLAKKLNNFILGEFYQCKAYEKAAIILRDALVEGTGCLKVYETEDHKVGLDRVLLTELLIDPNEAMYGEPRQIYQLKLIDRQVLIENFPKYKDKLKVAEKAYPDSSQDASKTISDQIMVVEGWHLRSGEKAKDGRHTIACTAGILLDEQYDKDKFPFVFLHYSPRLLGFWSQGVAEQLMGTQMEINSLLYTISRSIKLVGVPRVFIEKGSKVSKASNNNDIGVLIEYSGIKPTYEVAPCVPQEMYAQLERLIQFAYKQCGVSSLDASAEKPSGLNSGEAIRTYDDISTDRFAALSRRYDDFFVELAYQVIDLAKDIAKEEGSYQTVYPGKDGTKTIDLPKMSLLQNPFIIQCYNMSSLPKDPAGRLQKVTEMITSGMITLKEGRRLLDFPDLSQMEKLANASEERIFQMLDAIVEDGKPAEVDPWLDLQLASELTTQYINLYCAAKLEEEKAQMLRTFFTQVQAMMQAATPPPLMPPGAPQEAPGSTNPAAGVPTPAVAPPPIQQGVNSQIQ